MDRLHQFLNPINFQLAWEKVAANQGCAGVDRQTVAQFGQQVERRLLKLVQQVAQGTYRPLPLRQISIPKKSGGWRMLRVPTVRDRVVQQALLNVLHPVLDPQFEPVSFAYRPGRSHQLAVQQVSAWHRRGYDWLLDADIVSYFDRINHVRLLAEVRERLGRRAEERALHLIHQWTAVPTLTPAGLVLPERGIPQGSVVSPILANVYLDDFDEALQASRFKLVRFADDFVVMGRSRAQAEQAQETVSKLLDGMGLELHPDKTTVTSFNRGFRFLGHAFVGDLVVPVTRQKAKPVGRARPANLPTDTIIHADPPGDITPMQQALIGSLRQSQQPVPPPLYVVLGYRVRTEKRVEIKSSEVIWEPGMSTLYLVQQGTQVHKQQGRFVITAPQTETVEVLIREVERILVFGNGQLTTPVISTCLSEGISVVFLTQMGDYKGHLWSAEAEVMNLALRQFERHGDAVFRLETARAIVRGKLTNSRVLLMRLNQRRKLAAVDALSDGLLKDLDAVRRAAQIESLRGYEGVAASRYFQGLGQLITNPAFTFTGRHRRPPTDPVNSLLSFGYTLLHNHVLSLILAEGLNPYFGTLHGSDRKQTFLSFDLVEEFRSPVVDALVMRLINQKAVLPTDFTWPNKQGGVYLQGTARRLFLKRFEERLSQSIAHPDVQTPVSYRRVLQLQVQRYRRALMGGEPYVPFRKVK